MDWRPLPWGPDEFGIMHKAVDADNVVCDVVLVEEPSHTEGGNSVCKKCLAYEEVEKMPDDEMRVLFDKVKAENEAVKEPPEDWYEGSKRDVRIWAVWKYG